MNRILGMVKRAFLTGFIIFLPIAITIFVLDWLFITLDSILGSVIRDWFNISIPGVGILATVILILIIGVLTKNVVGTSIAKGVEKLFMSVPLIKNIYSPVKSMIKSFTGERTDSFRKVVLIEYPKENVYSIGLLTNESVEINEKTLAAVFIPAGLNPTTGFLIYVNPNEYVEIDMSIEQALKNTISMGSGIMQSDEEDKESLEKNKK